MNRKQYLCSYAVHLNAPSSVLFQEKLGIPRLGENIMTYMSKILIGAAGLTAALAIASPAMAQRPYPYANPNNNIVGAIINSVTGGSYGQYPQGNYGYGQINERGAVSMCAAAAEQRISSNYRSQPGYNNGHNGYQQGYANGYNRQTAQVLGITNVERRNNGGLKVWGVASSGRAYGYGNQGYGQGYNNQGYNNGYNGQHPYADQAADLRFTCRVNSRGQVSDVNISRNQVAYRGR